MKAKLVYKGGPGSGFTSEAGHQGIPGQVGGSSSEGGKSTTSIKLSSMKKITTLDQIIGAAKDKPLYIRWSRGPILDKKQKRSFDQVSHTYHSGLSAQNVRVDDPELLARMIPEYRFLKRKDEKIYPYIFSGRQNGVDSDGAPTIDADSIVPVGKISDELIAKCVAFSDAYNVYSAKYAYNAWKPETFARNAKLQSALDKAKAALFE